MESDDTRVQAEQPQAEPVNDVVSRIGQTIRVLRESMRELGLDQELERAAQAIPDARERLNYVGAMTEDAAERALNAVDRAQPVQNTLADEAKKLEKRWEGWFEAPLDQEDAKALVGETRAYLSEVPNATDKVNKELLEITMAQEFQDLTGQVIKRVIGMVHDLEFEMLQIVLDNVAEDESREGLQKRAEQLKQAQARSEPDLLNGPQVSGNAENALNNQDQVDDLLAELGF